MFPVSLSEKKSWYSPAVSVMSTLTEVYTVLVGVIHTRGTKAKVYCLNKYASTYHFLIGVVTAQLRDLLNQGYASTLTSKLCMLAYAAPPAIEGEGT